MNLKLHNLTYTTRPGAARGDDLQLRAGVGRRAHGRRRLLPAGQAQVAAAAREGRQASTPCRSTTRRRPRSRASSSRSLTLRPMLRSDELKRTRQIAGIALNRPSQLRARRLRHGARCLAGPPRGGLSRRLSEAAGIAAEPGSPLWRTLTRTRELGERRMSRADVFRMVKRRVKAAGPGDAANCHTFRASGITAYLLTAARSNAHRRSQGMRARAPRSSTTGRRPTSPSRISSESRCEDRWHPWERCWPGAVPGESDRQGAQYCQPFRVLPAVF